MSARAVSGLALGLLAAHPVWAASVDIVFTGTTGSGTVGGNTITAEPGDQLTAIVSLTADPTGVSSYGVSVEFDTDFGDELDLLTANELLSPPFVFNATPGCQSSQESAIGMIGNVLTCEAATFGAGPPPPLTVDIIELVFEVTGNVATDGPDIQTGEFNSGFDGVFDNAGGNVSPQYGVASIDAVPEPSAAVLLGLGLVGLARSRRRG